ncbi:MAG: hypothetical protein ABR973_01150 [Candidatus Acidiferrales bacterium]|jgi:hypothetical protein
MENQEKKTFVSPEKLAANRANAQRSTGPRTEAGREKSSHNAWQHGFFAKRLFSTPEQQAQDGADYELIANGIRDHYRPIGFMENFRVEKIATELLRSARLLSFEQKVLGLLDPFESHSVDRILRYQVTNSRQLAQDIEELERHQEIRRAKSNQDPPSDADVDNPPDEQNEEERPANEDQLQADCDGSSSGNCETNPTVSCETNGPIGVTPPPIANCGTNPTPTQRLGNEEQLEEQAKSEGPPRVTE